MVVLSGPFWLSSTRMLLLDMVTLDRLSTKTCTVVTPLYSFFDLPGRPARLIYRDALLVPVQVVGDIRCAEDNHAGFPYGFGPVLEVPQHSLKPRSGCASRYRRCGRNHAFRGSRPWRFSPCAGSTGRFVSWPWPSRCIS